MYYIFTLIRCCGHHICIWEAAGGSFS